MQYRIGHGIDAHKLKADIPLIIGGVTIPFSKGSKGHSDGDVLFHCIVDALLGALALGDIGMHFPSSDNRWKNANSKKFLEHSNALMIEEGYAIENIDATVILQEPKLSSYILQMRTNIANILSTDLNQISIKATTTDKMGFIGKGEGIIASSTLLVSSNYEH